jgi:hypothetical protein
MTATLSVQAQTYFYYPASVTSTPTIATAPTTTVAPTYYRRGLFGTRLVWAGSAPQYYQTAYTPQIYQPVYAPQYYQTTNQPQVAQPTSEPTTAPVSDTAAGPTTAVATATAPPATILPDTPATTPAMANADAGDPYGFTGWLNATRAAYGLSAVGHDPNLSSWAAENNNHQAARGMGHFVMGPARRQNSAVGSISDIGSMWMNSPAHRAALLDPTIRWIGIAGLGAYWTFNAN